MWFLIDDKITYFFGNGFCPIGVYVAERSFGALTIMITATAIKAVTFAANAPI